MLFSSLFNSAPISARRRARRRGRAVRSSAIRFGRRVSRQGHTKRRAILQSLEDRRVLAAFTVITPGDAGNGSCDVGSCTLRDAVLSANAAAGADTIDFAPSVQGTINLAAAFGALAITDPLAIVGPGSSNLTVNALANAAAEFRVFDIADTAGNVSLEGLTIRGGSVPDQGGGGIRFESDGELTIRDSVITGNTANNGGGIYSAFAGTVTVTDSTITGNTAMFAAGGGIHNQDGSTTLTSSVVSSNRSYSSGAGIFSPQAGIVTVTNSEINNNRVTEEGYHGGGVYSGEGNVTISGSTISGNTAGDDGGGVYSFRGNVSITSTTISNNLAGYAGGGVLTYAGTLTLDKTTLSNNRAGYGEGGGISNDRAVVTVTRSTISGNRAVSDGGGIANNLGLVRVVSSLLSANHASVDGGGIATQTGAITLTNSTVSGNNADNRGGGIQSDSAPVRLVNATLTLNSAAVEGGGVGLIANNNGESILIHNSIVAANRAPAATDFLAPLLANQLEVFSSLIGSNLDTTLNSASPDANGNYVGSDTVPINPFLAPLGNNGGPTQSHAVGGNSFAIDNGDNNLAVDFGPDGVPGGGDDSKLPSDQRGGLYQRMINFGGGQITDIGAIETQAIPTLTVDTSDDVVNGDLTPGDRSLRELVDLANDAAGTDTITFQTGVVSEIVLDPTLGSIVITDSVRIEGRAAKRLEIRKDPLQTFRLFEVTEESGSVQFRGVTLSGGNAGSEDGGAILSHSKDPLEIVQSVLTGNQAASGGAIAATNGVVVVAASTLAGNTASMDGGAVFTPSSVALLEVIDSTFSGNTAGANGGGLATASTSTWIRNSTFTLNVAGTAGGAIGISAGGSNQSLGIDNSIIAVNSAPVAPDFQAPDDAASNLKVNFSLVGDNTDTSLAATNQSGSQQPDPQGNYVGNASELLDPMIGPLADNGGPMQTHLLLENSLAIDHGDASLLPLDSLDLDSDQNTSEPLPEDQRGALRTIDALDISGAVELAAVPTINWPTPDDIVFGTRLSTMQLNAMSPQFGTFTYTPLAGTLLSAGDGQTLSAFFEPFDPLQFRNLTASVNINVLKADPVITWDDPDAIVFGTLLSAVQLNALADIPGTYIYDPAEGTELDAGDQTLNVQFIPTDSANFNEATDSVSLLVNPANPTLTWNDPAEIVFGTPLGTEQLNATANVAGTYIYSPPAPTVLDAGVDQLLMVTFTPSDPNFVEAEATVMIDVAQAVPVITWNDPAEIVFGTLLDATQLDADANVDGTFVYSPPAGTKLNAGDGQSLSVSFTPTDPNYSVVENFTVMIDVARADPVLTWSNPDDIVAGTPLSSTQLGAMADVPGTFVYSPLAGTILPAGIQTLKTTFTADDAANYNTADAEVMINVTSQKDYGDAPALYPVLLAQDGARHIVGSLVLGQSVDIDQDGQPSSSADGDGSDDDGVIVIADAVAVAAADTTSSFSVTASAASRLDAWIDFNGDGDWTDTGENIASDRAVNAGQNTISYTVPSGAVAGVTAARFRLSTSGGLLPTGEAADGEVEDYLVTLLDGSSNPQAIVHLVDSAATIQTGNGRVLVGDGIHSLFGAPLTSLGSLDVRGGGGDDQWTIDLASAAVSGLILDGGGGSNGLVLVDTDLNFTAGGNVVAENFRSIDSTSSGSNRVTVDAPSVALLSQVDQTITLHIGEGDQVVFREGSEWRLSDPRIEATGFFQVVIHQLSGETVEIQSPTPWRNPIEASDVDNGGTVTANDALRIINELARRRFSDVDGVLKDPLQVEAWPGSYYDQNGDGSATAGDALRVINRVAKLASEGEAEAVVAAAPSDVRGNSTGRPTLTSELPLPTAKLGPAPEAPSNVPSDTSAASIAEETSIAAESATRWTDSVDGVLSHKLSLEDWLERT